jgi:nitrogen-specific signal transduction histidine kinase
VAVILLDDQLRIRHLNPAAENLFAVSQRVVSLAAQCSARRSLSVRWKMRASQPVELYRP